MKKRTPLGTRLYRQSTLLACLILIASAISSIVHYQNEKKPILLYAFFSTFIASCFYIYFVFRRNVPIRSRYMDWILTTPLLLLELCFLTGIQNRPWLITSILFLNFLVFAFGYWGEIGRISRPLGCFLGFLPLLLFFTIFFLFGNNSIYIPLFLVVWSLYGITYLLPSTNTRNISYNVLDIVSKGVFTFALIISL
jgi:bacteriorhodopsin